MKKSLFTRLVLGMFAIWLLQIGSWPLAVAAGSGSVVINEVAWAGSVDDASDEYIELLNTTISPIDLTGWTIDDDGGASLYELSGTIQPLSYFLIEDTEAAVNPYAADVIQNLSLANSGDSLALYDAQGNLIDSVNSSGGAWFAGGGTNAASMERIDATMTGDLATNWGKSTGMGSTATASGGTLIAGTPGIVNSVATGMPQAVFMRVSDPSPAVGDTIMVETTIAGVDDLFSYGLEIDYDPTVLKFVQADPGFFLSEDGAVVTSFQAGLEDGIEGKLLIAEARTIDPKVGVSGDGLLATLHFEVIGGDGSSSALVFHDDSFVAQPSGEMSISFVGTEVTPQIEVDSISSLTAVEGQERYTIRLDWVYAGEFDRFDVYRMDQHGEWQFLASQVTPIFVDSDEIPDGGDIVPEVEYRYQVVVVTGTQQSDPVEVTVMETRALKGDNDRSDRVDGRDLDRLARHFAESADESGFEPLVDTTYDGIIDGSDLIDLGVNFALLYPIP